MVIGVRLWHVLKKKSNSQKSSRLKSLQIHVSIVYMCPQRSKTITCIMITVLSGEHARATTTLYSIRWVHASPIDRRKVRRQSRNCAGSRWDSIECCSRPSWVERTNVTVRQHAPWTFDGMLWFLMKINNDANVKWTFLSEDVPSLCIPMM